MRLSPARIIGHVDRKVVLVGAVEGGKVWIAHVEEIRPQLASTELEKVGDYERQPETDQHPR